MDVIINEEVYDVGVASVKRTIRREEKYNVMTEDGRRHREIRGVYLDFTLELGGLDGEEYGRLMEFLRGGEAGGDVRLQVGEDVYTGFFDGITDQALFEDEDGIWWDRLSLAFTGSVPVEEVPQDAYRFIY